MHVLELRDVVKQYQQHKAVDEVSFTVPKGTIFGLLGPNGAGKTTLIRIITTIIRADTGKVFFNGEKLDITHPKEIGYMPEERGLYKKMKVGEHLIYLARLKGLSKADARKKINEWFEKFEITDWWNKKVEELSKGMQQKIQFISTVVHEPQLLILDEPFSGLDPINTNLIKEEIFQLQQRGTTIIFSTHRMEQVEEICEYIVLINKGKNVLEGKVGDIKENFKSNLFEVELLSPSPPGLDDIVHVVSELKGTLKLQLSAGTDANDLLQFLLDQGTRLRAFREVLPSLNEIFIQQVNQIDHPLNELK